MNLTTPIIVDQVVLVKRESTKKVFAKEYESCYDFNFRPISHNEECGYASFEEYGGCPYKRYSTPNGEMRPSMKELEVFESDIVETAIVSKDKKKIIFVRDIDMFGTGEVHNLSEFAQNEFIGKLTNKPVISLSYIAKVQCFDNNFHYSPYGTYHIDNIYGVAKLSDVINFNKRLITHEILECMLRADRIAEEQREKQKEMEYRAKCDAERKAFRKDACEQTEELFR